MSLKKVDLNNYYDIEGKMDVDDFLDLLFEMNEEAKEKGYHSYCVTDALTEIYGSTDYEISYFTKEYGNKIKCRPNSNSEQIKIFGVVIDLDDLLLVCDQMTNHGYTPLDIVASFAIINGESNEISIINEVLSLYQDKFNYKQKKNKKYLLKKYGKNKK